MVVLVSCTGAEQPHALALDGAGTAIVPSEAGQAAPPVPAMAPGNNMGPAVTPGTEQPPGVIGGLPQGSGHGEGPHGNQLNLSMDLSGIIQFADCEQELYQRVALHERNLNAQTDLEIRTAVVRHDGVAH